MITLTTNTNIHHSNQKNQPIVFRLQKNSQFNLLALWTIAPRSKSHLSWHFFSFACFLFVRFPQSYAELLHQQALLLRCAYAQAWAWLPPSKKQKWQLTAAHFLLHRGSSLSVATDLYYHTIESLSRENERLFAESFSGSHFAQF